MNWTRIKRQQQIICPLIQIKWTQLQVYKHPDYPGGMNSILTASVVFLHWLSRLFFKFVTCVCDLQYVPYDELNVNTSCSVMSVIFISLFRHRDRFERLFSINKQTPLLLTATTSCWYGTQADFLSSILSVFIDFPHNAFLPREPRAPSKTLCVLWDVESLWM